MKRLFIGLVLAAASLSGCSTSSNKVTVCASEIPHAEILNECVKPLMEAKGYKLEVTVLDWTMQNDYPILNCFFIFRRNDCEKKSHSFFVDNIRKIFFAIVRI